MKREMIARELVAVARLLAKKGEVPEAFKKQWKDKDKDNDGKENEPKPDFLKKKDKKSAEKPMLKQDGTGPHGKGKGPGKGKADGSGKKAAETFKCPNCGGKVLEKTKYCVKCKKKVEASITASPWEPMRNDVNVSMRNKEMLDSVTSYAPAISQKMRKKVVGALSEMGYDVRPNELKREWSTYLTYIDYERNNNKYHYYVVYSFESPDGEELFTGWNCSGRVGIIERAYDLTAKYLRGPATSLNRAIAACEKHLKTKERKGYERQKMIRG